MLKRIKAWWKEAVEEFKELLLKSGMKAEAAAQGYDEQES